MKDKRQKELAVYRRHKRLYFLVVPYLIKIFNKDFNLICDDIEFPKGPSLILSNHTTSSDQFFILQAIGKNHTYFVASENPFRNKIIRKIVVFIAGVIIHTKGYQSVSTAKNILKQLKLGANVMVFPEGNTTFDGRTAPVPSAIAKLAKVSGANLVLLKMEGGYFSRPRWGCSKRKGQIHFSNKIYTNEQLKSMSVDEISKALNEGIYTDAYLEQENNPRAFVGKKRALGIESGIYQCPKCLKISSLKSDDTNLYCECGYELVYDEYGYLCEDNGRKFTITDLMTSQREYLRQSICGYKNTGVEEFLFEDDFEMYELIPNKGSKKKGKVHVKAFTNHIEYIHRGREGLITSDQIEAVVIFKKNTLTCFIKEREAGYELRGDFALNSLKYRDLFLLLREKPYE